MTGLSNISITCRGLVFRAYIVLIQYTSGGLLGIEGIKSY